MHNIMDVVMFQSFHYMHLFSYTLHKYALLQKRMAFYSDNEDVISAALTVTQSLLDKYNIDPRSVGRY